MGVSGMMGKVYYIDDQCPISTCAEWAAPTGASNCWTDEVTRFTIVDSVNKREYGHDKSFGWQDVVAGIRRLGITLDGMLRSRTGSEEAVQPLRAGRVVYLQLYPSGVNCSTPLQGYAMVDQISYTYDQERGDPISYTMTLSSKGPWIGFVDTGDWGGIECACPNGA